MNSPLASSSNTAGPTPSPEPTVLLTDRRARSGSPASNGIEPPLEGGHYVTRPAGLQHEGLVTGYQKEQTGPASALLPLEFDLSALRNEIELLPSEEWVPHFNTSYFTGDWSGVALRSVEGRERWLYPDPTLRGYANTPLLAGNPALFAALASFECPLLAARLLRLGPSSSIREHTDLDLGIDDGEARVHVVVQSDPSVTFWLNREPVPMEPGDAWYLNLNLPHRVENTGTLDRIHLVVDCVVNDWFRNAVGHRS
jgi:Aspartyl/Asparaginyl beta-hydroxylase